jgi:hypothetical protein
VFAVKDVGNAYAHCYRNPLGLSDSFWAPRGVNSTTNSHSCKTGGAVDWAGTALDTFC